VSTSLGLVGALAIGFGLDYVVDHMNVDVYRPHVAVADTTAPPFGAGGAAASAAVGASKDAAEATTTTNAPTTTASGAAAPTPAPAAAPAAGLTTAPPARTSGRSGDPVVNATGHKCYKFFARLNVNPLQQYKNNPDSEALGFATCQLCTDGRMNCSSLLHSGKSRLIASHIHMASGDDSNSGVSGEGPPVINFGGDNQKGMIDDQIQYPQVCQQWVNDAAENRDVPGVLVPHFNRGVTAKERVEAIAATPGRYYFNFHTLASWTKWYPHPQGIARGVLVLQ